MTIKSRDRKRKFAILWAIGMIGAAMIIQPETLPLMTGGKLSNRPELEAIEKGNTDGYSAETQAYFDYFGLGCDPSVEHRFGSFRSGGYTLAGHLYRPPVCKGTVVCLHGYLNHVGQLRHLIVFLLEQGYAVGAFDLPGHGLSGGEAAAIDSFEEYTMALTDFMAIVKERLPGPYHAVGFSTGCSIQIDGMLNGNAAEFEKVVMAAPLVHWSLYEQSKKTYAVYSRFTDRIPRFHQNNSSDRDYLVFNKTRDYLHAEALSLRWVKALFDWNERIESLPPCGRPVLILQGDRDSTVDWKYNLKLLREKFPAAEVRMLPDARHELFNESLEIRLKVLYAVAAHLKDEVPQERPL